MSNEPTIVVKQGQALAESAGAEDRTVASASKSDAPPVFTVDTNKANSKDVPEENDPSGQDKGLMQAQTPKHANKMRDENETMDQQKITPDRGDHKLPPHHDSRKLYPPHPQQGEYGNFPPPRGPYEGRPPPQVGGNGAFQPHERRQLPPPGHQERGYYNRPPMQVSPGNGGNADFQRRNYVNYTGRNGPTPRMEGGYPSHPSHPPPHQSGYYDQRGYSGDYGHGRPPAAYDGHRGQYGQPLNGSSPSYPPQTFNRYPPESRVNSQSWVPPPYAHSQGGGQFPPGNRPPEHYQRPTSSSHDGAYPIEHHAGNGAFSRSVSTSFDRSVKSSRPEERIGAPETKPVKQSSSPNQGDIAQNHSIASDDCSWKQLKQVHSVDDIAVKDSMNKSSVADRQPTSTSSSLTNSPTEGPERLRVEKHAQAVVEAVAIAVAQPSSLDSLSSVASTQPPMKTNHKAGAPQSPGSISASLDLMKCSSESSGLLHLPPQQRQMEGLLSDGKRARDEERGDDNTAGARMEGDEIRRAPSGEQPAPKRVRMQDDANGGDTRKKSSPLSITCSPSAPKQNRPDPKSRKLDYHASPDPINGFYDKSPQLSYSMDSAPSIPRDSSHRKQSSYTSLPPRPGSSSSSTITGGHLDTRDPANAIVPSIASWEIHAQDSFGNGSVGGGQALASSFSFQDYPTLSASESNLGGPDLGNGPPHHHQGNMHATIESRNQSFEGGHYHGGGSFHRNDSMDYGGRAGPYQDSYKQHGHSGPFPPHAPSWGTAASGGSHPSPYQQHGPPPGHYNQYGGRNYPPHGGMMRNYSQESHRASPPPGLHSRVLPGQGAPQGFHPPPEFAAPHNPHLTRRPPPAVYITTSSQNGSNSSGLKRGPGGVFSWTKDDDLRLTEIMKKYKNPRDWEPIAKEHGAGKTAKECHERWIRYLKPGVRKGQWTDHEDAIVIEAVSTSSEQPFTRWSDLAQRLPGRVGKQIRDRWVNHLNPNINHLPFSRDDDLLLWEGHIKLGKRWVEISTKFFNCSRSENHIKNRWYSASFKKFISNEFGPEAYAGAKGGGKSKVETKSKKKNNVAVDPTIKAV